MLLLLLLAFQVLPSTFIDATAMIATNANNIILFITVSILLLIIS